MAREVLFVGPVAAVSVEQLRPGTSGGHVVQLRSSVAARSAPGQDSRPVLDWRFWGLLP